MADLLSRPFALSLAVFFYTLGFIVVASSRNVEAVVAGQVIYTLGTSGITQVSGILLADITSLQWRGAVVGAYSLPWVLNAFVAGYITDGISAFSENGWRWGYGMFTILVPVCIAPSLIVLFWGDRRAKKLGGGSTLAVTMLTPSPLACLVVVRPPPRPRGRARQPPHLRPERHVLLVAD